MVSKFTILPWMLYYRQVYYFHLQLLHCKLELASLCLSVYLPTVCLLLFHQSRDWHAYVVNMAHPYPVVVFAYLLLLLECSLAKSKYSFFDQTLDHFNPQNNATYRQRFYVQTDYCTESPSRCPIFLYICGEYTCEGIPDDYIQVLAQRLQAVIVMPEHRYYGQSMPFEELTVENLRFLSSKQAICVSQNFTAVAHSLEMQ